MSTVTELKAKLKVHICMSFIVSSLLHRSLILSLLNIIFSVYFDVTMVQFYCSQYSCCDVVCIATCLLGTRSKIRRVEGRIIGKVGEL